MVLSHARLARPAVAASAVLAIVTVGLFPASVAAQDGPETPVVGFLTAISEKRFDDLGQYFCAEFADRASGFDLGAAMAADLPEGIDPQLAVDAMSIAVTGPSGEPEPLITVLSEDEAVTTLGVEATLTVTLDPEKSEAFVRAIVENELQSLGMDTTDENVEAFMTIVRAQLDGQVTFSEYLGEVAEVSQADDGTWLICGGSIVASDSEPTTTPEPSVDASRSASPEAMGPLPYAEYVAALEAFSEDDPFAGLSDPPTLEEILAGFEKLVANATVEQERLVAVQPEDCYAEAHQELLAYWQSSIEASSEAAAQLEASGSLDDLPAIADGLDETLQARHPIAYVESERSTAAFGVRPSTSSRHSRPATRTGDRPRPGGRGEGVRPGRCPRERRP